MVNTVILIGRVGKKPEITYSPNGTQIAKFSLATDEKYTDKNTGEKKTTTEWHRLTCFNKLASIVEQYVNKGMLLYVSGKIQYGSYEKSGVTHYTTDIIFRDMQMLSRSEQKDDRKTFPNEEETPF